MSNSIITDTERRAAREAVVHGYNTCPRAKYFSTGITDYKCDCPEGQIGACEKLIESIALAIATARKI